MSSGRGMWRRSRLTRRDRTGWSSGIVVGVDRAGAMVDRARGEIRHRGISNAFVARMDAMALAFPENVFDTVFCGFALNGLSTPTLALRGSPVCCVHKGESG